MSVHTGSKSSPHTLWLTRKKIFQLAVTASLILLGDVGQSLTIFRELQQWLINTNVQLFGVRRPSNVSIVEIDRNDYAARFNRRSPLDADKMREVLISLAAAEPRLLLVDIDTSHTEFEKLADLSHEIKTGAAKPIPVLWARDAQFSNERKRYFLANILGLPRTRDAARYGAAVLQADNDRIVRRYSRMVDTDEGQTPTLAFAAIRALQEARAASTETKALLVRWRAAGHSELQRPSLRAALKLIADPKTNPFRDTILIVGGAYDASDEHLTPVGWLRGTEVVAQIIETELEGGGRAPANQFWTFIIALVSAVAVYWFIRQPWKHGFTMRLAAVVAISVVASLLATSGLQLTPQFILVLVVMWVYQTWSLAREQIAEKKRQEQAQQQVSQEMPV